MRPAFRRALAALAPAAIAVIAIAVQPESKGVLMIAAGIAVAIAVFTGLFTAARDMDMGMLMRRLLTAMLLRLVLTGTAVLILADHGPAVTLVLAGGVAAAVLCEALLLIPQRESVRA